MRMDPIRSASTWIRVDAAKAFEGVCLPFGGVKGSVLGTLMDLMSGVLTGVRGVLDRPGLTVGIEGLLGLE